jgi:hypothetical protein
MPLTVAVLVTVAVAVPGAFCVNVTLTEKVPGAVYVCAPLTANVPLPPPIMPAVLLDPSPQSMLAVKSADVLAVLVSVKFAIEPLNALPTTAEKATDVPDRVSDCATENAPPTYEIL